MRDAFPGEMRLTAGQMDWYMTQLRLEMKVSLLRAPGENFIEDPARVVDVAKMLAKEAQTLNV